MSKSEFSAASLHANDALINGPVIHDGFAEGIKPLNRSTPSPDMISKRFGRAYKVFNGTGVPYFASKIHASVIGENEESHFRLMQSLNRASHDFRARVYMGCAGLVNLGYIAAMKPGAAIFFDINPFQSVFWNAAIDALAHIPLGKDFVHYLQNCSFDMTQAILAAAGPVELKDNHVMRANQMDRYQDPFRHKPMRDDSLFQERAPTGWWAHDAQAYGHLHDMARRGALGALTLDVTDPLGWAQLGRYLSDQRGDHANAEINRRRKYLGMIYFSNALDFLKGRHWNGQSMESSQLSSAIANVSSVCDPQGLAVIDARACASLQWPHLQCRPRGDILRLVWNS